MIAAPSTMASARGSGPAAPEPCAASQVSSMPSGLDGRAVEQSLRREAVDLRAQHEQQGRAVLGQHVLEDVAQRRQRLAVVGVRPAQGAHRLGLGREDRRDHVALGAEVPVDERVVDAGGGGDVAHADAVDAASGEQLARGRQDRLSGGGRVAALCAHHPLPSSPALAG